MKNQKANFIFLATAALFLLGTGQVPMGSPNQKKNSKKIKKLVSDLTRYNKAYRSGKTANPADVISDEEYDNLRAELEELDPDNKFLLQVEVEEFYGKKVKHTPPMLSTEKSYSIKKMRRYLNEMAKVAKSVGLPYATVTITPKLDGIAIDWSNNTLSTRGDGNYGNDITRLVKAGVTFVPESMRNEDFRGELVISRPYFDKNLSQYAMPRSFIAGVAGAKTIKRTPKKVLKDGAIHAVSFAGFGDEQIQIYPLTPENIEYILANLNTIYMELVNSVPYDCDGIVFSVIDEAIQKKVGRTGKHWRYQIAYKVRGKQEGTTITKVIWKPGRYGYLTPLLVFDPVEIDGSKITRASGHNLKVYREKGLGPGAKIKILRSGEIIPYVSEVVQPSQSTPYPLNCPYCETKTLIEGPRLICPNPDCSGTLMKRIRRFMEKMEIKFFGEATIYKLVNAGYKTISSVLSMKESDFIVAGFSEKMSKKLYKSLQDTYKRRIDKATLLGSIGIEGLGMTESKKFMTEYPDIDLTKLDEIKKQQLTKLPGVGTKTANTISKSLQQMQPQIDRIVAHEFTFELPTYPELEYEKVFTIIDNLYGNGPEEIAEELAQSVSVEHLTQALEQAEESQPKRSLFTKIIKLALAYGETSKFARPQTFNFLFSGVMDFGSRKDIQNYAKEKGHDVAKAVSKNVDFMVVGEKPGASKVKKANQVGVKIITEKEFFDMVP